MAFLFAIEAPVCYLNGGPSSRSCPFPNALYSQKFFETKYSVIITYSGIDNGPNPEGNNQHTASRYAEAQALKVGKEGGCKLCQNHGSTQKRTRMMRKMIVVAEVELYKRRKREKESFSDNETNNLLI